MSDSFDGKTDIELVHATLANPEQFLHLMNRYEQKLLRYIHRITAVSKEEGEDVLQDVFLKVYQNLRDVDESLSFSSWIYRITHNQVISQHRKRSARPQISHVDDEVYQNIASEFDLVRDVDRTLLKERLSIALEKLDEKYRDVLILKFLEEKSYDEISDILKKPSGTIGTLINRAKKQLAKHICQ